MLALQWNINVIWRLLLGVGAIPGLVVLYLRLGSAGTSKKCKTNHREKNAKIALESNCSSDLNGGDDIPNDNNTDEATASNGSPALEAAVSSLFSSDIPTGSSDGGDAENELALVDNSHIENDNDQEEKRTGRAGNASSNEISMTPMQKPPRGL